MGLLGGGRRLRLRRERAFGRAFSGRETPSGRRLFGRVGTDQRWPWSPLLFEQGVSGLARVWVLGRRRFSRRSTAMARRARRRACPRDLTDARWAAIAPMIPDAAAGRARPTRARSRTRSPTSRGRAAPAARFPALAERLRRPAPLAARARGPVSPTGWRWPTAREKAATPRLASVTVRRMSPASLNSSPAATWLQDRRPPGRPRGRPHDPGRAAIAPTLRRSESPIERALRARAAQPRRSLIGGQEPGGGPRDPGRRLTARPAAPVALQGRVSREVSAPTAKARLAAPTSAAAWASAWAARASRSAVSAAVAASTVPTPLR